MVDKLGKNILLFLTANVGSVIIGMDGGVLLWKLQPSKERKIEKKSTNL